MTQTTPIYPRLNQGLNPIQTALATEAVAVLAVLALVVAVLEELLA